MIPAESAHDTVGALGDVGLLQFKDLNADKSAFQRTYANQVSAASQADTPKPATLELLIIHLLSHAGEAL